MKCREARKGGKSLSHEIHSSFLLKSGSEDRRLPKKLSKYLLLNTQKLKLSLYYLYLYLSCGAWAVSFRKQTWLVIKCRETEQKSTWSDVIIVFLLVDITFCGLYLDIYVHISSQWMNGLSLGIGCLKSRFIFLTVWSVCLLLNHLEVANQPKKVVISELTYWIDIHLYLQQMDGI